MRWFGAGVLFGTGLGIGFIFGHEYKRHEMAENYRESAKSLQRVIEREQNRQGRLVEDGFMPVAGSLVERLDQVEEAIAPMITPVQEEHSTNDYHKAVAAMETDFETFVDGGVNDYGMSYIDEEDYLDEGDGRDKLQIVIHISEFEPIFTMGGVQIDDWDKRVGDSILVDFYKLVPPGVEPVLYVRNHRTDEDYEVIREAP